jgi:hypothetical protein
MSKKYIEKFLDKIISSRLWVTIFVVWLSYKGLKIGFFKSEDCRFIFIFALIIYGGVKAYDAYVNGKSTCEPKA